MDKKIFDYHNGLTHLKNSQLTFIGDVNKRIKEDYIRIVRFYRFLSLFKIPKYSSDDFNKINHLISKIKEHVSNTKIRNELIKILKNPFPKNSLIDVHKNKNKLIQHIENFWISNNYREGINDCIKLFNKIINDE